MFELHIDISLRLQAVRSYWRRAERSERNICPDSNMTSQPISIGYIDIDYRYFQSGSYVPLSIMNYHPLLQPEAQIRLKTKLRVVQWHCECLHYTNVLKPNGQSRNLNVYRITPASCKNNTGAKYLLPSASAQSSGRHIAAQVHALTPNYMMTI